MADQYLITGANRGLGLEMARALHARGDRVIATARDPHAAKELNALGVRVEALDVASDKSVAALVRRLENTALDVLINNAGRQARATGIEEVDGAEMARAFEINAIGPLRVTRAMLPRLKAGKRKLVVHITSKMGTFAQYSGPVDHGYRASKAALNMLHRCMSDDLEPRGITCVAIHPGWVRTDMGGRDATLSAQESVAAMLNAMDRAKIEDTGALWDHEGQALGW